MTLNVPVRFCSYKALSTTSLILRAEFGKLSKPTKAEGIALVRAMESVTNRVGKWRHVRSFAAELVECTQELEDVRAVLSEVTPAKATSK